MPYFNEPWRALAKAAKLRDWDTIDAVLEDLRVQGRDQVIRGFCDAQKELSAEPALTPLSAPDPVTIHDLPSRDGIEIVGTGEGEIHTWRPKRAA